MWNIVGRRSRLVIIGEITEKRRFWHKERASVVVGHNRSARRKVACPLGESHPLRGRNGRTLKASDRETCGLPRLPSGKAVLFRTTPNMIMAAALPLLAPSIDCR